MIVTRKMGEASLYTANAPRQGNVYVWKMVMRGDLTSIIPVCKFLAHHTYITRVLLSPDVRHLATCSADHTSRIWSVDLASPHNVQPGDALPSAAERDPAAFPLDDPARSSAVGMGLRVQRR
ncbi:TOR complex subunit lst8 [Didymella sp. IMI 355093]|nr:TOR complex subunit lst8 [Didymella sp. IMI 355093]